MEARKHFPSGNEQNTENTSQIDCPTVLSEEFVAVNDDNVCTAPIMADKDTFWSLFKAQKNTIDAYFDGETEMNDTAPVPT
ncbi:hypothetical protein TNCV_5001051 [Trichonephila clavipes]|nr:hypothetical protein TNCV_5001051 [Trichonephila clavipes]